MKAESAPPRPKAGDICVVANATSSGIGRLFLVHEVAGDRVFGFLAENSIDRLVSGDVVIGNRSSGLPSVLLVHLRHAGWIHRSQIRQRVGSLAAAQHARLPFRSDPSGVGVDLQRPQNGVVRSSRDAGLARELALLVTEAQRLG